MSEKQSCIRALKEEYSLAAERRSSVWQTFAWTFVLAVTGIFAGIGYCFYKMQESHCFHRMDEFQVPFVAFPFVISAWLILMMLQYEELEFRARHMMMIEDELYAFTRYPVPGGESRVWPLVYSSRPIDLLKLLVGLPMVMAYLFTAISAIRYLGSIDGLLLGMPRGYLLKHFSLVVYAVLPVLTFSLFWWKEKKIRDKLKELGKGLEKKRKEIIQQSSQAATLADPAPKSERPKEADEGAVASGEGAS